MKYKKRENFLPQREKDDLENLERYIEEFSIFLPLAVCTLNPVGIFVDINNATKELTGYNEVEIVGKKIEFLFAEEELIRKFWEEVIEKQVIKSEELTLLAKSKKKIPVSISASVRKDYAGNLIGCFLAISNITKAKESQLDLEEKVEERTRDLVDARKALTNMLEDAGEARKEIEEEKDKTRAILISLSDGLIVFGKDERILLVNPEAEEILAVEEWQIINRKLDEVSEFSNLEKLYQALGQKIEPREERYELTIGGGSLKSFFQVSVNSVLVSKKTIGFMIILHDVTRDKLIDRMKTEFISIVAHQLRTPLSAIKWVIKMVLDGDAGKLNAEQQELLFKGYRSNERIIKLVNDLLDVSRIEEGRFNYNFIRFNFQEALEILLENVERWITKNHLKLLVKKPKKMPVVYMDKERIVLAIQNVLDNAIKYTPEYGKIELSIEVDRNLLKIIIKDSGVGIPSHEQSKLFSKFFRANNVVRIQTEGTGLGLFITRNIVVKHGGEITISSEEGKGTKAIISLPLKK
ncbi:MAG: ATP-binding protein [Patescibacteria group bacterium]